MTSPPNGARHGRRNGPEAASPSDWDAERTVAYLLRLLTRRDHARAELEERLRRKGVEPQVATAALARLEELDLLDDRRVAEGLVRARRHRKGRHALARDLHRFGVPGDLRDAALAPLHDEDQERTARQVLDAHAWRFAAPDRRKAYAKAAAFLARRGFPSDPARAALDAFFENRGFENREVEDRDAAS
ncbi:MAG: regulatory protein RecX [Trueperaceae bacterium]